MAALSHDFSTLSESTNPKNKINSFKVKRGGTALRLTKEQVDSYEENGFLILENLFSEAEIEILLAELPKLFAEDTPRRILEKSGAVRTVFASHFSNEAYHRVSRLPRLVEAAQQLLGSEVYIHQFKINAKVALAGDQWEWHQDFLYWHKEDGMMTPRVMTALIFLQEANEFNGPLLVIPGSHKEAIIDVRPGQKYLSQGSSPNGQKLHANTPWMSTLTADLKYKINKEILARLLQNSSIRAIKGPAGLALLFHGSLFHASAGNLSPDDRLSLFITYNSVENPLRRVEKPRPAFIANPECSPITPLDDGALLEMNALTR